MLVKVKFLLMLDAHCVGEGPISFQLLKTQTDRIFNLEHASKIAKAVKKIGM